MAMTGPHRMHVTLLTARARRKWHALARGARDALADGGLAADGDALYSIALSHALGCIDTDTFLRTFRAALGPPLPCRPSAAAHQPSRRAAAPSPSAARRRSS